MKTTIIELLTKISKYENMPYKIEYKNEIYTYDEKAKDYKGYVGDYLFDEYVISDILNDDVYILETTITYKQNEKINHLEDYTYFENMTNESKFDYLYEMITRILKELKKINEIIEALNER